MRKQSNIILQKNIDLKLKNVPKITCNNKKNARHNNIRTADERFKKEDAKRLLKRSGPMLWRIAEHTELPIL